MKGTQDISVVFLLTSCEFIISNIKLKEKSMYTERCNEINTILKKKSKTERVMKSHIYKLALDNLRQEASLGYHREIQTRKKIKKITIILMYL